MVLPLFWGLAAPIVGFALAEISLTGAEKFSANPLQAFFQAGQKTRERFTGALKFPKLDLPKLPTVQDLIPKVEIPTIQDLMPSFQMPDVTKTITEFKMPDIVLPAQLPAQIITLPQQIQVPEQLKQNNMPIYIMIGLGLALIFKGVAK